MKDIDLIEMVKYRRDNAFETINEIESHISNNYLAKAMNRIYYSGFYIVSAITLLYNFSSSKHSQLLGFFNREYIHSGLINKETADILIYSL